MAAVGVPVIAPVAVFKLKPAGNVGLTKYEVGAPPALLGEFVVIAAPGQYVGELIVYVKPVGVAGDMVMLNPSVVLPQELVAVTV